MENASEKKPEESKRMITVTAALSQLKNMKERLDSFVNDNSRKTGLFFIGMTIGEGDKRRPSGVNQSAMSVEMLEANIKSNHQAVASLYNNYTTLKARIVESNAKTLVKVAGEEMPIASAIVMKSMQGYNKALLMMLMAEQVAATNAFTAATDACSREVAKITKVPVDESTAAAEMVKAVEDIYNAAVAARKAELSPTYVDPIKLDEEIKKLKAKVEFVETELDSTITVSNSTTFIEAL